MTDTQKESFRHKICAIRSQILFPILLCLMNPINVNGELLEWSRPDIDQWMYPAASTPGMRILGPTFASLGGLGGSIDPARRGATMLGFNTSGLIETGLEPHRYEINSIRIGLTMAPGTGEIVYDNSYDVVDELIEGTDDPGRPIELYGIGFRNDYDNPYEKLGFGPVDYAAPEFEEGTSLYSSDTGAYDLFPLGDDGAGNLTDVFNSPTGGYRAGEDEQVPAWDTIPWAIGVVSDLNPGATVPYESDYVFDVDLSVPNVLDYLQQSLADGGVGFFVSSLHQPAGHTGTVAYPQWYLKEHPRGTPATMEVDVAILPDSVPGDFDGDQVLSTNDINVLTSEIASGADDLRFDVNGDMSVDDADLSFWVKDIKQTWFGDADLDGEFNSNDLIEIFVAGKYEKNIPAVWSEGDWNADATFSSSDLIVALSDGGYEVGTLNTVNAVPEPGTIRLLMLALVGMLALARRTR